MPRCGSQVVLCSYPIRYDPYRGCSHACQFCFTRRKSDDMIGEEAKVTRDEGVKSLRNFIEGERHGDCAWCDWNIPLHIGGMSDCFQPIEAEYRVMYEGLKLLAETQYPFIISTKGRLAATPEYLDVLSKCNVCFQISLISPEYDKITPGAPPFAERVEMVRKISAVVPRMIIRIQPYMIEQLDNVMNILLPQVKEAGAFGVTIEGLKCYAGKRPGMQQIGGDMCYPDWLLEEHFTKIRDRAKDMGLGFYCGENRLRWMGDSIHCCGADDLDGFVPNVYNLNGFYSGLDPQPTERMKQVNTTACIKTLQQAAWSGDVLDQLSFDLVMREIARSKYGYKTMGLEIPTRNRQFDVRM